MTTVDQAIPVPFTANDARSLTQEFKVNQAHARQLQAEKNVVAILSMVKEAARKGADKISVGYHYAAYLHSEAGEPARVMLKNAGFKLYAPNEVPACDAYDEDANYSDDDDEPCDVCNGMNCGVSYKYTISWALE